MGSSAGWKDVFSLGGYSAQRKMARAQEAAAAKYAAAQEKVAASIEASATAQPQAVKAATGSTQQVAESNVQSQQKRKKTVNSTVHQQHSNLGNTGGRTTL